MATSYEARNRGAWLGSGWALLAVFVVMANVTVETQAEQQVLERTTHLTTTLGLKASLLIWQAIAYPATVYTATLIVAAVLWRRIPHTLIVRGVAACALTWGISSLIKLLTAQPRPPQELVHASSYAFPSGHAANATAAAVVVATWLFAAYGGGVHWVAWVAVAFVVLTCLDRLLLGVHYPSDVVAGVIVGLLVPAHFHFTLTNLRQQATAAPGAR